MNKKKILIRQTQIILTILLPEDSMVSNTIFSNYEILTYVWRHISWNYRFSYSARKSEFCRKINDYLFWHGLSHSKVLGMFGRTVKNYHFYWLVNWLVKLLNHQPLFVFNTLEIFFLKAFIKIFVSICKPEKFPILPKTIPGY